MIKQIIVSYKFSDEDLHNLLNIPKDEIIYEIKQDKDEELVIRTTK